LLGLCLTEPAIFAPHYLNWKHLQLNPKMRAFSIPLPMRTRAQASRSRRGTAPPLRDRPRAGQTDRGTDRVPAQRFTEAKALFQAVLDLSPKRCANYGAGAARVTRPSRRRAIQLRAGTADEPSDAESTTSRRALRSHPERMRCGYARPGDYVRQNYADPALSSGALRGPERITNGSCGTGLAAGCFPTRSIRMCSDVVKLGREAEAKTSFPRSAAESPVIERDRRASSRTS